ncbi:MAG: energy-coupling factor ABC transporter ATP-binding protein, partial [Gemmataceae bacterium]
MAIVLNGLSHRYGPHTLCLDQISGTIAAGETVALLGANGTGKTTLLHRLAGLLPGTPGQALIAGLDPATTPHRTEWVRRVGIVFQNPDDQLFSPTILEDVAFGPRNLGASPQECRRLAEMALKEVGLSECAGHSPLKLSGGQKRRAAIATVLSMNPSVWLFDEPTAYLDASGRTEFLQILQTLPGTKLIATHDLELVRAACPRVWVLAEHR